MAIYALAMTAVKTDPLAKGGVSFTQGVKAEIFTSSGEEEVLRRYARERALWNFPIRDGWDRHMVEWVKMKEGAEHG
jgi:hypothetical protein